MPQCLSRRTLWCLERRKGCSLDPGAEEGERIARRLRGGIGHSRGALIVRVVLATYTRVERSDRAKLCGAGLLFLALQSMPAGCLPFGAALALDLLMLGTFMKGGKVRAAIFPFSVGSAASSESLHIWS